MNQTPKLSWYQRNREKAKSRQRKYYLINKKKIIARAIAWNKSHPEKARASIVRWNTTHRDRIRFLETQRRRARGITPRANQTKKKKWIPSIAQKQRYRATKRRYYLLNREKLIAQSKDRARRSYDRLKKQLIARRKTDLNFRMKCVLRGRLASAMKSSGTRKTASALIVLGCSIANFRIYIESRFEPGMSWENHGKVWHLDHIIPCAIFDLSKPEHQKACFHFSNLQPLFKSENCRKSDKLPDGRSARTIRCEEGKE
jgi:hypothetical protein